MIRKHYANFSEITIYYSFIFKIFWNPSQCRELREDCERRKRNEDEESYKIFESKDIYRFY